MNYLLDTHTFLWSLLDTDKLSTNSLHVLQNKQSDIFVSSVTFWEISIKSKLNKFIFNNLNIPELPQIAVNVGYILLNLNANETSSFINLETKENLKDPFDRMLIWQAINNNLILISKDKLFNQYKGNGLKLFW